MTPTAILVLNKTNKSIEKNALGEFLAMKQILSLSNLQ